MEGTLLSSQRSCFHPQDAETSSQQGTRIDVDRNTNPAPQDMVCSVESIGNRMIRKGTPCSWPL